MTHLLNDDEDDDAPEKDKEAEGSKPQTPSIGANLFKSRTILIFGEIKDKTAEAVTAQLLALSFENSDPIRIVISSPGGHVESGDVIHDMIRFVEPEVKIIGTGWVASAAAHIFLGAKRENRYCLPNTRFMMHQPWGGVGGKVSDIDIEAREILKMRERINREIADETGQPIERVRKDTDRNFWLGPEEAKAYGIVTHVVKSVAEVA